MNQENTLNKNQAWDNAVVQWNRPSIPRVITPVTLEDFIQLEKIGEALKDQLAFMKYPEFQTYINLEKITKTFSENPQRGLSAIASHEVGHRFCPFDQITLIILQHMAKKGLEIRKRSYDLKSASAAVVNLYSDMCINTRLVNMGNEDIPWAYQVLSKDKDSSFWRVYAHSMELVWKKDLLPKNVILKSAESQAAVKIAHLFSKSYFDKSSWPASTQRYAEIIGDFFEVSKSQDQQSVASGAGKKSEGEGESSSGKGQGTEGQEGEDSSSGKTSKPSKKNKDPNSLGGGIDEITANIPKNLDDKTLAELAKRLAELGNDGLPTNQTGLEDFKSMVAGYGKGDPVEASIAFYEMLSRSYEVSFSTRPFGRPRQNPYQPIKWQPSMNASDLDVNYSVAMGGRIIPGVSTYTWNSRKREIFGGIEEIVPDLDLYLDSSGSMENPLITISLPVLAGFVLAKKAIKKGAKVRCTNFSGHHQKSTQDFTRELPLIYKNLVVHYGGGTVFPQDLLLSGSSPKQVVVITDTFLGNPEETVKNIRELRAKHSGNRVTIYAIHSCAQTDYYKKAGAEIIQGTTPEIFKKSIGKASEIYKT